MRLTVEDVSLFLSTHDTSVLAVILLYLYLHYLAHVCTTAHRADEILF